MTTITGDRQATPRDPRIAGVLLSGALSGGSRGAVPEAQCGATTSPRLTVARFPSWNIGVPAIWPVPIRWEWSDFGLWYGSLT